MNEQQPRRLAGLAFGRCRAATQAPPRQKLRTSPASTVVTFAAAMTLFGSAASSGSGHERSLCAPSADRDAVATTQRITFADDVLQHDHYGGVTLHLENWREDQRRDTNDRDAIDGNGEADFASVLAASLEEWREQGKKGIWIHVPADQSDKVHAAVSLGFDFHMVVDKKLVLTTWLDTTTPSRLPIGPTHQVGVGCLVLHPHDPSRMLVVQEKSGPAAALGLWKMPTGLADPGEDIHQAAVRELREETGLDSTFRGVLTFRQAHATGAGTVSRANSDLFFVCRMDLTGYDENSGFTACPDEIADIQWMPVEEYCAQARWQGSPVYMEMNRAILESSRHVLFGAQTLPLGFAGGTNALYISSSTGETP
jgi:8-oxo-dGTP pyrophosphatase MutT (NUDIX family)